MRLGHQSWGQESSEEDELEEDWDKDEGHGQLWVLTVYVEGFAGTCQTLTKAGHTWPWKAATSSAG